MLNSSIKPGSRQPHVASEAVSGELGCAVESMVAYRLAASRSDLETAFSLAHESYVEAGLMKLHPSGMRITPYLLFPQASVIAAMIGDRMVGTLATLRETPIGLPHFRLLDEPLCNGVRPVSAEGTNFAVLPEYRSSRSPISLALACYCAEYAMRCQRVDRLVAVVHPRQAHFYEDLLKYSRLRAEPIEHYDLVDGAPAIVDYIEPLAYPEKLCVAYGLNDEGASVFAPFFDDNRPTFVFPGRRSLKVTDCVWTPELLNRFLHERAKLWEELTSEQRWALRQSYWPSEYDDVFGSDMRVDHSRVGCYDVFALAHVETCADRQIYPAVLRAVSSNSITIQFPRRLVRIQTGEPVEVTIMTDQGDAVRLRGKVEVLNGGWSARLLHGKHPIWNDVLGRLEDDYFPATRAPCSNATL